MLSLTSTSNEGEFIAEFPPILGYETVGSRGRPLEAVQALLLHYYCPHGEALLCEKANSISQLGGRHRFL
ncbi:hypothetical protein MYCTH_2130796 [Thermothelomyces thermophilus ATCC 42464]|uniref:Uncharacterized protein n=1 Tax=Thermothelomyces thermophilus (strain ATCC 42464 / BCRC 31852 / DSM 1799) TaxID=573729 RepID=G2QPW2_THET4|nr:uncharacterized protein MYCTH_2130796 [Thermothelomyces thermophilus ATCC 42464]AEO61625.1 hypothetical protein MYCTH_2130796 [Thermothelomyces thermophilus ATCC 42464]